MCTALHDNVLYMLGHDFLQLKHSTVQCRMSFADPKSVLHVCHSIYSRQRWLIGLMIDKDEHLPLFYYLATSPEHELKINAIARNQVA